MKKHAVIFLLFALVACGVSYSQGTTEDTTKGGNGKKIFFNQLTLTKDAFTTVLQVPSDKVFILTDMGGTSLPDATYNYSVVIIYEDDAFKYDRGLTQYSYTESHFNSGIVFSPNSIIKIQSAYSGSVVYISGYYASSAPYGK